VLHGPDYEMPTRPVPSVRVTAIGTCSIAVPNLVDTSRAPVQRRETAFAQTRLTFHKLRVRTLANRAPHQVVTHRAMHSTVDAAELSQDSQGRQS